MARLYIHFDANPIHKQFNGNSKELQRCHEKKKKRKFETWRVVGSPETR